MVHKTEREFECQRCGRCCKQDWDLNISEEDIAVWMRGNREDILRYVVLNPICMVNPERYVNSPQWVIDNGHIFFGDLTRKCPFLREAKGDKLAKCRIHKDRAEICKGFPFKGGKVRTDVIDWCEGARLYHRKPAKKAGFSLDEYIEETEDIGIKGKEHLCKESSDLIIECLESEGKKGIEEIFLKSLPEEELKIIARCFKRKKLKVRLTSERGKEIFYRIR
jgi:Fe-S-cluster containining protein